MIQRARKRKERERETHFLFRSLEPISKQKKNNIQVNCVSIRLQKRNNNASVGDSIESKFYSQQSMSNIYFIQTFLLSNSKLCKGKNLACIKSNRERDVAKGSNFHVV